MASINSLVSQFANTFKEPNNFALRSALKDIIMQVRAELIRHNYEQHGYVDKILLQRFTITLKQLQDGELNITDSDVDVSDIPYIYKSETKIPRPVRLTNNLPFDRVSTVGFSTNVEVPFIKETSARFKQHVPGLRGMLAYDYINEYLYIFTNKNYARGNAYKDSTTNFYYTKLVIESSFENPNTIEALNNSSMEESIYFDENEFLLPDDMVGQIKDIIYKRDLLNQLRETNETPDTIKY